MEQIKEFIETHKKKIIITIFIIILLGVQIYFVITLSSNNKENKDQEETIDIIKKEENKEQKEEEKDIYIVDIKGEVKYPSAYEVGPDTRVKDVINLAGGLTNNADTSATNLSLKVKDEMVIIIYSKNQIKELTKVKEEENKISTDCNNNSVTSNNACLNSNNNQNQTNSLININTATKEQLLTLSGIGDAKASDIIAYRKTNGNFKDIAEIKNVTGIGESIYAQIKDFITV